MRMAVLGLVAALAAAAPAAARPLDDVRAAGTVRVAVYSDNAPWSSGGMDGSAPAGIDVDLARAIAGRLGVRIDFLALPAGEAVEDDLRNAIWKGHYLGYGTADVMMHVPVDPAFARRNDNVVIFGPYQRDGFALALDGRRIDPAAAAAPDGLAALAGRRVGVELATLPDYVLMGFRAGA